MSQPGQSEIERIVTVITVNITSPVVTDHPTRSTTWPLLICNQRVARRFCPIQNTKICVLNSLRPIVNKRGRAVQRQHVQWYRHENHTVNSRCASIWSGGSSRSRPRDESALDGPCWQTRSVDVWL